MTAESYDDLDELPAPPRKEIPTADRELLELAARALGAEFEEVEGEGYGNLHFPDGSVVYSWNSLEFSGDAFELQVKLGLTVERDEFDGVIYTQAVPRGSRHAFDEPCGVDPVAATRRAVTRAAAEIGRATP
jgi:hypothetical protein